MCANQVIFAGLATLVSLLQHLLTEGPSPAALYGSTKFGALAHYITPRFSSSFPFSVHTFFVNNLLLQYEIPPLSHEHGVWSISLWNSNCSRTKTGRSVNLPLPALLPPHFSAVTISLANIWVKRSDPMTKYRGAPAIPNHLGGQIIPRLLPRYHNLFPHRLISPHQPYDTRATGWISEDR